MINGQPAVLIDPACEVLVEGFEGGYAFPEIGSSGEFKTEPIKNEYSHVHDALQYAATKLFGHNEREIDDDEYENTRRHHSEIGRSAVGGY
jgi:hypothetical protein